ncbi:MAG: hypothetical protein H6639_00845 [Caldilineaceae bacterium]|nr:hypothetical protein [Caldilineaceae bacterium]
MGRSAARWLQYAPAPAWNAPTGSGDIWVAGHNLTASTATSAGSPGAGYGVTPLPTVTPELV